MENLTTVVIKEDSAADTITLVLPSPDKKRRKCQPLQGKLNQLIVTAKHVASMHGHLIERFYRNYETGTAVGICKKCSCSITVDAKNDSMGGGELKIDCQESEF